MTEIMTYRESREYYPNVFSDEVKAMLKVINREPKQRILSYLYLYGKTSTTNLSIVFGYLKKFNNMLDQLVGCHLVIRTTFENGTVTYTISGAGRDFIESLGKIRLFDHSK